MNQQGFAGVADADPLGLCIPDNLCSHLIIRRFVHINMTVSGSRLDHGYRSLIYHSADQPCPAPRNQHIHIPVHFHKLRGGLPGSILNQ